jgi:hypothetical protein
VVDEEDPSIAQTYRGLRVGMIVLVLLLFGSVLLRLGADTPRRQPTRSSPPALRRNEAVPQRRRPKGTASPCP